MSEFQIWFRHSRSCPPRKMGSVAQWLERPIAIMQVHRCEDLFDMFDLRVPARVESRLRTYKLLLRAIPPASISNGQSFNPPTGSGFTAWSGGWSTLAVRPWPREHSARSLETRRPALLRHPWRHPSGPPSAIPSTWKWAARVSCHIAVGQLASGRTKHHRLQGREYPAARSSSSPPFGTSQTSVISSTSSARTAGNAPLPTPKMALITRASMLTHEFNDLNRKLTFAALFTAHHNFRPPPAPRSPH
ncbi:hypothetical protein C8R46DRAFT_452467 [Mycena filopes]|nr:hypothetical protein C8R46DRAFT_452467 [Mycena filopes]